jgi:hypothetical protein
MLRYGRSKSVCFAAERALSNRSSLIGRSEASAFQTFRGRIVGVARAPALLSGIGAQRPFQYGIRRRGGTISVAALRQTNGRPDRFTNSPHPPLGNWLLPSLTNGRHAVALARCVGVRLG